ncbi:MAG: hypothetical protein M3P43_04210 [Actinomycetota bacterium]|nr:hypothetical protein [Actinomycetota bacterium]
MLGISTAHYHTLKFFHVLAAITWVGSNIYAQVLATRVMRESDPARLAATVPSAWNFTDTWVLLGLAGIAVTIATGAGFLGPGSERLGKLGAERDPSDPEIQRRIKRTFAVSRFDLVVLILIVADRSSSPES